LGSFSFFNIFSSSTTLQADEFLARLPVTQVPDLHMVELASLFLPAPVRFNLTELVWSNVTVESSLFPKTNSTTVV
jgi:hypothetical protein